MRHTMFLGALLATAVVFAQQLPPPPPDYNAAANNPYANDPNGPPDEPGRPVARLSVLNGDASVRRGNGDWTAAALNAPLQSGDAVSVTPSSTVELQFDAAQMARFAGDTEARLASLDTFHYQIQLAKGLVTWRVLRTPQASAEIETPQAAVRPVGESAVRVEVAPDGTTRVIVRHGAAEVSTPRGSEQVHEGNMMLIRGSADDPEFQVVNAPAVDAWDNWNDQRDGYLMQAQSPRYLSQGAYGGEDLDRYGRWSNDPAYGDVWAPNVASGWAPYTDGRWVWDPYYGWTWIDNSPWGWAPFHYGSWYFRTGFGWCWFPGHPYERVWWRPALVSFVGFGGFGSIGWVPLAPYERFHPWYGHGGPIVSRTFVNGNVVNNYRNARVPGGVVAVSSNDFQRGNFRNRVNIDSHQLQQASLVRGGAPVGPSGSSYRFSDRMVANNGPRADFNRQRFFSSASNPGAKPAPAGNGFRTAPAQNGNWDRFGSPGSRVAPQPQPVQRGLSGKQPGFNNAGRPAGKVEVAPPIVRQRNDFQQSRPEPARPPAVIGGFGAPQQGSPRQAPPAPQFRQMMPRQEMPQRQAPAPQMRQEMPRSAPAPQRQEMPRGGGNAGGGNRGNGGGGGNHGGGNRR
jgi:hypothetical protein